MGGSWCETPSETALTAYSPERRAQLYSNCCTGPHRAQRPGVLARCNERTTSASTWVKVRIKVRVRVRAV